MIITDSYFDINELIRDERIITYFQPILSVKKKSLVGLEALSRGVYDGQIIPPKTLFDLAESQGLTLELDRLCRKKALEAFNKINRQNEGQYILFINFDSSIVDQGVVGSGYILETVRNLGLNPGSIAIEINEAKINNLNALDEFINTYKSYGFMIALDDIGAGYSSLNRLAIAKPDILKIDMMLIKDIDNEFYKQEVVRSLINLSRKLGTLVVAEGVETQGEAITCLNIGADMLQGYYFTKPYEFGVLDFDDIRYKKKLIAAKYKEYALSKANEEKSRREKYFTIVNSISKLLSNIDKSVIDAKLSEVIFSYDNIECIYVLDMSGLQYSQTICNKKNGSARKKAIFSPTPKGTDHSLKDYFYLNVGGYAEIFVTEPYISLATGNLCVTVSGYFKDSRGERLILCVDAIVE